MEDDDCLQSLLLRDEPLALDLLGPEVALDAAGHHWCIALCVFLFEVELLSLFVPFLNQPLEDGGIPVLRTFLEGSFSFFILGFENLFLLAFLESFPPELIQGFWFTIATFRAQVNEHELEVFWRRFLTTRHYSNDNFK